MEAGVVDGQGIDPLLSRQKKLTKTNRNNEFLETLEALFIRELKPNPNTKEDFRNKELGLKF